MIGWCLGIGKLGALEYDCYGSQNVWDYYADRTLARETLARYFVFVLQYTHHHQNPNIAIIGQSVPEVQQCVL